MVHSTVITAWEGCQRAYHLGLFDTPFGIGGDATLTITRDGNAYVGVGPAGGLASGSPSVRGGWLDEDNPTDCEIKEFVNGWSASANAGWGLSGGMTYGFDGTSTEFGVGLGPSADSSLTHNWKIFTLPLPAVGVVLALLIGGLLVAASSSPGRFDRTFGPAIRNQWSVGRSLVPRRRTSYDRFARHARLAVLTVGALFILAGGLGALSLL